MQDITELERRIAAAFDRIDRGLERADRARATDDAQPSETAQADTVQTSAVLRSLEVSQAEGVEWARRCAALEAQLAEATISMAAEIAQLTAELATANVAAVVTNPAAEKPAQAAEELDALKDQLSELRDQIATQSVELTQLRAQRGIEIEELKSIVSALTPLIEEANPNARN